MTVAAIVLAGGAATRFGSDKLAASIGGTPILHHALRAVAGLASSIVLVLSPDAPVPALPANLAGRIRIARDPVAHQGPLAGLGTGIAALPADATIAVAVAGDMPSLVPAVLDLLVEALADDEALGVVTLGSEPPSPLPAALRPAIALPAIEGLLGGGRRSLRALGDAIPTLVLPADSWRALDAAADTLRDIDRPEDLSER